MALKARRSHLSVSLFPFLSILCCVIGTLTLILAGIVASARGAGIGDEYVQLQTKREETLRECTELERRIAEAVALADKLAQAQKELEHWEHLKEAAAADEGARLDLLARLAAARSRLEEVSRRLQEVEDMIRYLESLPADGPYKILRGQEGGKIPRFVECTREGLRLDANCPEAAQALVATGEIRNSARYTEFLASVRADDQTAAVLVLRPGGVSAYRMALVNPQKTKTPHGAMAVPSEEPVDYSDFPCSR